VVQAVDVVFHEFVVRLETDVLLNAAVFRTCGCHAFLENIPLVGSRVVKLKVKEASREPDCGAHFTQLQAESEEERLHYLIVVKLYLFSHLREQALNRHA
jgi:hypothetical protein